VSDPFPLLMVRLTKPSPVRAGTAHTTKSTRPHPLLARLMRERLREHSAHLEAQHAQANVGDGDGGEIDDDETIGGDERENELVSFPRDQTRAAPTLSDDDDDDVDDDDLVDDFDDSQSDEEFDLKSARERNQNQNPNPPTPEGRRLVDLVRAEADRGGSGAGTAASPSQRRVNSLLRMEREVSLRARRVDPMGKQSGTFGSKRSKSERAKSQPGLTSRDKQASASFAKQVNEHSSVSTRSAFLNFAGSFFGGPKTPGVGLMRSDELTLGGSQSPTGLKRAPSLSKKEASALFMRLHFEKLNKPGENDPDETFAPKISQKSKRIGSNVHARENGGLLRVEYLLQKGTETLREKARRTEKLEHAGGGESTTVNPDANTIDPSHFFLDTNTGRPRKPGDSYVRSIRTLEDAELARNKKLCTFTPKIGKASLVIVQEKDRGDPAGARRGPLGMYARGVEFLERRKREAAAAEAERRSAEDEECTFRPRSATEVPGFVKRIAAKTRENRTVVENGNDGREFGDGFEDRRSTRDGHAHTAHAVPTTAAPRSAGWLVSPTFQLTGWRDTFRIGGGGGTGADLARDGHCLPVKSVTDDPVPLPSAPADHPARHRLGAHLPIHSELSHYKFRAIGASAGAAAAATAKRIARRAADAAHSANLESLFGEVGGSIPGGDSGIPGEFDLGTRTTGYVKGLSQMNRGVLSDAWRDAENRASHVDANYFELTHLERNARARSDRLFAQKRLTKYDGSGWQNRVTEPKAPTLGVKPDMSKVRALRRPLVAKREAADLGTSGDGFRKSASRGGGQTKTGGYGLKNSVTAGPDGGSAGIVSAAAIRVAGARDTRGQAAYGGGYQFSQGTYGQTVSTGLKHQTNQPPPVASPLFSRLATGSDGYFKDVRYRTGDASFSKAQGASAGARTGRGPPGWSDATGTGGTDNGAYRNTASGYHDPVSGTATSYHPMYQPNYRTEYPRTSGYGSQTDSDPETSSVDLDVPIEPGLDEAKPGRPGPGFETATGGFKTEIRTHRQNQKPMKTKPDFHDDFGSRQVSDSEGTYDSEFE
jgi:hypothetical protein